MNISSKKKPFKESHLTGGWPAGYFHYVAEEMNFILVPEVFFLLLSLSNLSCYTLSLPLLQMAFFLARRRKNNNNKKKHSGTRVQCSWNSRVKGLHSVVTLGVERSVAWLQVGRSMAWPSGEKRWVLTQITAAKKTTLFPKPKHFIAHSSLAYRSFSYFIPSSSSSCPAKPFLYDISGLHWPPFLLTISFACSSRNAKLQEIIKVRASLLVTLLHITSFLRHLFKFKF